MNKAHHSKITLQNEGACLTIDLEGGAITDFHLKGIDVNPLSFSFSKQQMPEQNQSGAAYQGHFLCLGRWGEGSTGEINAGVPNHGAFANILWTLHHNDCKDELQMEASSLLEGLKIDRTIVMDKISAAYLVNEMVHNFNPLGRLYNMVQHPTVAQPFLDNALVVDCNATVGFDQANYKEAVHRAVQWPFAEDEFKNKINVSVPTKPYNAVFSFVVQQDSKYGWLTAYSEKYQLLLGYLWLRKDYPWIHLWQHWQGDSLQYRGLEFGTAGIHQPFKEILNTATALLGEKTFAYIDAGEIVSRKYLSFIHHIPQGFEGVQNITIEKDCLQIQSKSKGNDIVLKLTPTLIDGLSK